MKSVNLRVDGEALLIEEPKAKAMAIHPGDVLHAWMYKHDDITTDLVCCELEVTGREGARAYVLHEELGGWPVLLAWLEALPGFRRDWRESVIQPPMQENRTLVYQAAAGVY